MARNHENYRKICRAGPLRSVNIGKTIENKAKNTRGTNSISKSLDIKVVTNNGLVITENGLLSFSLVDNSLCRHTFRSMVCSNTISSTYFLANVLANISVHRMPLMRINIYLLWNEQKGYAMIYKYSIELFTVWPHYIPNNLIMYAIMRLSTQIHIYTAITGDNIGSWNVCADPNHLPNESWLIMYRRTWFILLFFE